MISKLKEPVSALLHFGFGLCTIPISLLLIFYSSKYGTIWHIFSFCIFGIALLLLYMASTIYHSLNVPERVSLVLKRIDHMMIFILIAGSYTPICLIPLRGVWGYTLLSIVWSMALGGIFLKAFWIDAPRWLSTLIYVIMGWSVVIAFYPLIQSVPINGIVLLALGGITYTIGAIIYAVKWPHFKVKWFNFHDLFHLFVMGGSTFHIIFMFKYVLSV